MVFSNTSYSQNDDKRGLLIDLYPNPSTQYINIKFENNRITDDFLLSIHSLIGNRVDFISEKIDTDTNIIWFEKSNKYIIINDLLSDVNFPLVAAILVVNH